MSYIHQGLVGNEHWYQRVNEPHAGGMYTMGQDTADNVTGAFGPSTGTNNGRVTFTYKGFSDTPVVVAQAVGADSDASHATVVNVFGANTASCGVVALYAVSNTDGDLGTASNHVINVLLYGKYTGTVIT